MKFIVGVILSFLIALVLPGYAQKGTYLTVYGMGQRTFIYNSMEKNHADLSQYSYASSVVGEMRKYPTYSIGAGLLFKHVINRKILFCYGFQYSPVQQSWSIYDNIYQQTVRGKFLLTYLKIPICIQYNYLIKNKYHLFFSGGPQLSVLLTEKGAIPYYGTNAFYLDLIDPGGVYHEFTFDGVFTTGGELKIYKNTFAFLQARIDYSFTNSEKQSFHELEEGYIHGSNNIFQYPNGKVRPHTHNISASICLGMTFKIK